MSDLETTRGFGFFVSCVIVFLLPACSSGEWETSPAQVTRTRILAIEAIPAESRPLEVTEFRAIVAGPNGPEQAKIEEWTFCTMPPRPGQRELVSDECRNEPGIPLSKKGNAAWGAIPQDVCRRFGPDPLPTNSGDTSRPRDADSTGGYYVPLRITAFGERWFYFHRVNCPLADAPSDVALEFSSTYTKNLAPEIKLLKIAELADDSAEFSIELLWPSVSQETYPTYDVLHGTLREQREHVEVDWLTNAGDFAAFERTTSKQGEVIRATWIAQSHDSAVENVWWWAVVRDSRGALVTVHGQLPPPHH